ncbi:MAG: peptidylprolyl isomerase [Pyrinomonadaceae bacterium]
MLNPARLLMIGLLCVLCGLPAPAQETPAPLPSPTPAPPEAPAPKKANERPAAFKAAAEPYDAATVAQMAGKCVRLDTEAGEIALELLPEAAPESVRNFLNLAATGAFDTTSFNRVVKGFVVQGGNLSTREAAVTPQLIARAGRTVPDEPSYVKHVRGVVSMARPETPNSATTHFFILVGDAPHLDGTFAAFGRVTGGMEAVDQINGAPGDGEKPSKPVRLRRASVAPCNPQ